MTERGDDGNKPGADREGDFQAGGRVKAGQQGAEHGDAQDAAGLPEGGEGAGRDPGLGRGHAAEQGGGDGGDDHADAEPGQ